MEKEIVEKNLVPIAEVRRILEERQKEGELKYTQRITLEHAQRFAKISATRSFALISLLKSEFNLSDSLSVQIVNMIPRYLDEIRVFFTGQKIGVLPRSDEEIILILRSLMEYTFSILIEQQLDLSEAKVIKLLQWLVGKTELRQAHQDATLIQEAHHHVLTIGGRKCRNSQV